MQSRGIRLAVASLAVLLAIALTALVVGPSGVSAADVLALASGAPIDPATANILINIRFPRVAAALLAGGALAVSGALIQAVLDNPLASPNIIGVNSGAGLAVLVVSALPVFAAEGHPGVLPVAAFAGALLASAIMFLIAARTGVSRLTVVLAGVALNAVFGAGTNTILAVAPNIYVGSSSYLIGGFSGVLMSDLVAPAILCALGFVAAMALASHLNVLSLGASQAHAVGMPVEAVRIAALAAAALLAGSAVSFAGLLGFVGLVVPHVVRRVAGSDCRWLIPLCAVWGAAFTCLCDTVARAAFAPYELPVGIILAFIGGPFFIYLIMRGRGYRDE